MNTPGERLKYYIEYIVDISVTRFAQNVGVEPKTIYGLIKNERKAIIPKATNLKIISQYPKFPIEWIKKGGITPSAETGERIQATKPECEECKQKDKELEEWKSRVQELKKDLQESRAKEDSLMKQLLAALTDYKELTKEYMHSHCAV